MDYFDFSVESGILIFFISSALFYSSVGFWKSKIKLFVPYTDKNVDGLLVVDCSHPYVNQLTHHLKGKTQRNKMDLSLQGDTSTDAVINAVKKRHSVLRDNMLVTANHFDIDSFLSVWCCLNCDSALNFENIIRDCARIGDFRELRLDHKWQDISLRLACYLNSQEKNLFYRPFESEISLEFGEVGCNQKFEHFLPIFHGIINSTTNPDVVKLYSDEYDRVVAEYNSLEETKLSNTIYYHDIGLVLVHAKEPLHYYSLFSQSIGFDIVLSIYSNGRYELEQKYTTHVDIASRHVLPRVNMVNLARVLNRLEESRRSRDEVPNTQTTVMRSHETAAKQTKYQWVANRYTDSGPLLRLESSDKRLTKAERYGHPFERPIYSSLISPETMTATVISFFQHSYRGIRPKMDWEWEEIHEINNGIDWRSWEDLVIASSLKEH